MGKKIFGVVLFWTIVASVPAVFSAESSGVRESADKLIKIDLTLSQGNLSWSVSASGTPLGSGIVVTNWHVFDNAVALREEGFDLARPISEKLVGCYVAGSGPLWFSLRRKKADQGDDVAILEANLRGLRDVMISTSWDAKQHRDIVALYVLLMKGIPAADKEPMAGDPVYFAGFSDGSIVVREGVCRCNLANILTCNGNAERGMSGGVILDRNGAAVGINAAKLRKDGEDWVKGPSIAALKLKKGE